MEQLDFTHSQIPLEASILSVHSGPPQSERYCLREDLVGGAPMLARRTDFTRTNLSGPCTK